MIEGADMPHWQKLIDQLEHYAAHDALVRYERFGGADENELAATESRLGFAFDAQYRDFLTHVNGWDAFSRSGQCLYRTDELGASGRWLESKQAANEWRYYYDEILAMGMPPLEELLLIGGTSESLSMTLCGSKGSSATGRILTITSEFTVWPDFSTYLTSELEFWKFVRTSDGTPS